MVNKLKLSDICKLHIIETVSYHYNNHHIYPLNGEYITTEKYGEPTNLPLSVLLHEKPKIVRTTLITDENEKAYCIIYDDEIADEHLYIYQCNKCDTYINAKPGEVRLLCDECINGGAVVW